MNKRLLKTAFGIALGFTAVAAPGYAGTFLDFSLASPGVAGGTIGVTGNNGSSNETLSSMSGVTFNTLIISNALDAADDGTWLLTNAAGTTGTYATMSQSGNTLTLNGDIKSCVSGACLSGSNLAGVSGNLETIVLSGLNYGNAFTTNYNTTSNNPTSVNVSYGTPTSITDLTSLVTNLDNGTVYNQSNTGNGAIVGAGPGTPSGGPYSFTASSETLNVTLTTTATPEPVTLLLFGSGLLGVVLISRRRSVKI